MCGIAILARSRGGVSGRDLLAMTRAIAHRGPDGEGHVLFGPDRAAAWFESIPLEGPDYEVGLGHRRLAIIDLSPAARQPMELGDLVLTFNGEIYNYPELAETLARRGHRLRSHSDAEVLLHAYAEWGDRCVEQLNGIFAFAVYDRRTGRLVLVRDRLGVKPLYYALSDGELVACSEIKGILAVRRHRVVDETAVYDLLTRGRMDHTEATFFEGIRRLPAGSRGVWLDGRLEIDRYWSLDASRVHKVDFETSVEQFGGLLRDAVRIQLRSDVPVGAFLSGGLDSSSLVSLASQLGDRPLEAFTARFEDRSMDEWSYAAAVEASSGALVRSVWIEPSELWSSLDRLIDAQEEPIGDPSAYAQWCLMHAVQASGTKVVLSGQGGDEVLCGYAKYFYLSVWGRLRAGRLASGLGMLVGGLLGGGSHLRDARAGRRYAPGFVARVFPPPRHLARRFAEGFGDREIGDRAGDVTSQQLLDLTRFSLPVLLRYEDKSAMAHSVESRVPFLDHRLVECALAMPEGHKVRGADSKRVLRATLAGTVPEKVLRRRSKLAFGGRYRSWARALQPGLRSWASRRELAVERFVDRDRLLSLVERRDPAAFGVLALDRWMEHFGLE